MEFLVPVTDILTITTLSQGCLVEIKYVFLRATEFRLALTTEFLVKTVLLTDKTTSKALHTLESTIL